MRQSLTESQQCQQYYAEAVQCCINRELPAAIARNTKFYVNQRSDSFDWVVSLVSTFAKRLVKSELVSRETESAEKRNVWIEYSVPDRPIDHLFVFLANYVPWFHGRILYRKERVSQSVDVINAKYVTNEHYHLLPMEGDGHEMRYYLMSWDGEYYDGSPTEWNDLRNVRAFAVNMNAYNPDDCARLQRMIYDMDCNRDRLKSHG